MMFTRLAIAMEHSFISPIIMDIIGAISYSAVEFVKCVTCDINNTDVYAIESVQDISGATNFSHYSQIFRIFSKFSDTINRRICFIRTAARRRENGWY